MYKYPVLSKLNEVCKTKSFLRFIVPIAIISSAKLLASFFLYNILGIGQSESYWMTVSWGSEGQNDLLVSTTNQVIRWPYLFLGWDSGWYLSIVAKGYAFSSQSYAFFPGFPLFIWLINLIIANTVVSMVLFSLIIGVLWLPIYQLLAENYMDKSDALKSTLYYGFFPYVFLFTTVTYAEGLFLASVLGAWYFFKKRKFLLSSIFASVAAVSRSPGIFIMIPILYESLQIYKHGKALVKNRQFLYFALPFMCFFFWMLYCKILINDWLAPFDRTYWNDMHSLLTSVLKMLSEKDIQNMFKNAITLPFSPYSLPGIVLLIATPILIYRLFKVEKALAIYSIAYYGGVLMFGSLLSTPRYLSFQVFVWMPFMLKISHRYSRTLTAIICILFYSLGIFLWRGFLVGEFIT